MNANSNPFQISSYRKKTPNHIFDKYIFNSLENILGFSELAKIYETITPDLLPSPFIKQCLSALNIHYESKIGERSLAHLKQNHRPLMILSNHPFGALEALITMDFCLAQQSDFKVVANQFLLRISQLSPLLIGVSPFSDNKSKQNNRRSLHEMFHWLNNKQKLLCYPAGNVAHLHLSKPFIRDPEWRVSIAKLARITQADILPLYIEGKNSPLFYALGPTLHALRYPKELLRQKKKKIILRFGDVITFEEYEKLSSDEKRMFFFRQENEKLKTYR